MGGAFQPTYLSRTAARTQRALAAAKAYMELKMPEDEAISRISELFGISPDVCISPSEIGQFPLGDVDTVHKVFWTESTRKIGQCPHEFLDSVHMGIWSVSTRWAWPLPVSPGALQGRLAPRAVKGKR